MVCQRPDRALRTTARRVSCAATTVSAGPFSHAGPGSRWTPFFLVLCALALLTACARTPVHVYELPEREADLYPTADVRQGVTVAVDEIRDRRRSERYFGVDLPGHYILPVQIIVSNRGEGRISVRPEDVLLLEGRQIHDPLPLQEVTVYLEQRRFRGRAEEAEAIWRFFEGLSLREHILAPGETYRAVLFYEMEPPRRETRGERFWRERQDFLRMSPLFGQPRLQLRLVLTELDEAERLRFGPFAVGT